MSRDRSGTQMSIANLLSKLNDPDPDIRFMQLSDLSNLLNATSSEYLRSDPHMAARIIEGLLKALSDPHGEVQNQALKCIGPLARRTPNEIIAPLIDKLTDLTTSDIDISIPNTALRTLIAYLPQPHPGTESAAVNDAYIAVSKVLIPRLVGRVVLPQSKPAPQLPTGLLQRQKDKGYSSDAVDVMIEIVKCYGPMIKDQELVALAQATMNIIESPQAGGVVKKRALAGIGALLIHFNDSQVSSFVNVVTKSFQSGQLTVEHQRFLIATIGTLARSSPAKFGPYLDQVVPSVLQILSQEELSASANLSDDENDVDPEVEELRETALVALEALLGSCPVQMKPHLPIAIESALRFLKYDPNVADHEDDEMGGTQESNSDDGVTEDALDEDEDEDDEYAELDDDDTFSDVDDMSWKVRRCAAKTLHTIVSAVSAADRATLFGTIAPVLISRLFNEREDSVQLELISTTTALIRKTGSGLTQTISRRDSSESVAAPPNTRKRRRQDSEADRKDPDLRGLIASRSSPPILPASPPTGSQAELLSLVPKIVQALSKLWKKATISLRQAAVTMLKTLALARNGILSDHLQQLEDPIADALKHSSTTGSGSTSSGTSATIASLQIETLNLISAVTETNETTVLVPFVIALIPPVTAIARERNFKVSTEALSTIEQFAKALTPPRLSTTNQDHAIHIEKLWDVVVDRVTDNNTDLEVRHRAIQVFGVLLARTSSTQLLPPATRTKSLGILNDRLKNETTRLASARAIGLIGEAAGIHDNIGSAWIQDVSIEMANQLRKADRALRTSCLESLQYLALNPVTSAQYETETILQLEALLLPLVTGTDLHLLTPALVILSKIIPTNADALVNADIVNALCSLTKSRMEGPPLRAYLLVVKVIGEHGVGAPLMKGLLSVGTAGETVVLGRAIGTLLVYGGDNLGVTISDFLKELEASQDIRAVCLALAVLGEVGFRAGTKSPFKMDVFVQCLSADSDKVRLTAAVALGSASSNNVVECLPVILQSLTQSPSQDYLYLHSLKEILEHSESSFTDMIPFLPELWEKLFAVSQSEDNSAVGAECIGRLATIDPNTYIPQLFKSLEDTNATVRGTVISAFRYTLGDVGTSYNTILSKTITPILKTMLSDSDLGNRRLAVTTLNAAIHNKPELIIADIGELLPIVLDDSRIKPELVKVIKIGPFTHHEDSGLDLRKSTYATMYALLDTPSAVPHLPIPKIFDRILDGIPDDHDIRTLCNLMLGRLSTIDPDETRRRLSPLAEKFRVVLGTKIKENAVKQEIEKVNEANAAVIRTTLELDHKFPTATTELTGEMVQWKGYIEFVKKEFTQMVRNILDENS